MVCVTEDGVTVLHRFLFVVVAGVEDVDDKK